MKKNNASVINSLFLAIFFVLHYLYFALFCRYHLGFQEQTQLFRFSSDYFLPFLSKPGGLSEYAGTFLIQFYQNSWVGAGIVTLVSIALFLVTRNVFKKFNIQGICWSVIPIVFITALQSHHHYYISSTIALVLALGFTLIYLHVKSFQNRLIIGIPGWIILYILAAAYSFLSLVIILLYEILERKEKNPVISGIFLIMGIAVPFIASWYIWQISTKDAWTFLFPLQIQTNVKWNLPALLLYYPVAVIVHKLAFAFIVNKLQGIRFRTIFSGMVILVLGGWWIQSKAYDAKTEIMLGIDYQVCRGRWDDALYLSSHYPGSNRVVTYYTNLALFNRGQLLQNLFGYNQIGSNGLFLSWETNNLTPLFGMELYYQMGYTNEAFRWAFEAMVANGLNPRSLRMLVLSSLVNEDTVIASKYITLLEQTFFYRQWAKKYRSYLMHSEKLDLDKEIALKRNLRMTSDFWADDKDFDKLLLLVLYNHPENIMAFEYHIACLLLEKNLDALAKEAERFSQFGYRYLPKNYEEAILVYEALHRKNALPAGYYVSRETQNRFSRYLEKLGKYRNDPSAAANALYKDFGNTFWYYMNFYKGE